MSFDLSENATTIFNLRYPIRDAEGKPTETPEQVVQRVVQNVASVNALYTKADVFGLTIDPDILPVKTARRQYDWLRQHGKSVAPTFGEQMAQGAAAWAEAMGEYEEMILERRFFPNSPTWTGAGTPLGQLAACFVLPIADDLARGRDSIFGTLTVAALIQQTGGGNGFSFGRLRPKGSIIKTSMGQSTGPVGFLKKVYDPAFGAIAQGGSRRGANMGILPVSHPDIREFMQAKVIEGEIANFNISIALTDAFMHAVTRDETFELEFDGVVYETIQARDLFREIAENAWVIGDPGNLFIDRAHDTNPCPDRYTIEATNPCGEQFLGPYENCCLGSIATNRFVTQWFHADHDQVLGFGRFDWDAFAATVRTATRFLDDVVDANQYVPAVPELEDAAQGGRRIGLGLMGIADTMMMMGIRYGSPEGEDFLGQLTEFARYHCMLTSIERAKERGPFPWIKGSIYDPELISEFGAGSRMSATLQVWAPPTPQATLSFGRPVLSWEKVIDGLMTWGIRNSCLFTFAPTGTISNVADLEGSGLEPAFALSFIRKMMQEGENIQLSYLSPLFHRALVNMGIQPDDQDAILAAVKANNGSCQGIGLVPPSLQNVFVTAADVTWREHILMQAAAQRWVDNSISKTINMPNEATVDDVEAAYLLAWKRGCKGITIYRQGSRDLEVLSSAQEQVETLVAELNEELEGTVSAVAQLVSESGWPMVRPMPHPSDINLNGLACRVFPVETFYGTVQAYITERADYPGRPWDIRLQLGKGGNDTNANVEGLGRTLSVALRSGVAVDALVDQLVDIGGHSSIGFGPSKVRSIPDGIGKLLRRLYMEGLRENLLFGGGLKQPAPSPAFDETVESYSIPAVTEQISVSTFSYGSVPTTVDYSTGQTTMLVPTAVDYSVMQATHTIRVDPTMLCPMCHNATLVMESGCRHCDIRLGGCGAYSGCD